MRFVLRATLVLLGAVVVQTSVLVDIRVLGVAPELVLLVGVLAAVTAGPQVGAAIGFNGGLVYDAVLETPFGLAALAYCLTCYAMGSLSGVLAEGDRRQAMVLGAGGTATGVAVFAAIGELLGQSTMSDHPAGRIVLMTGLLGGALAPLVVPMVRWMVEPVLVDTRATTAGGA